MKDIESMWNDHWSIMKPAYFIIWFAFNINFRFSIKWYSKAQKVIKHKYVKYTCSMEIVQQNGRFTLFSSKFHSNICSILFGCNRQIIILTFFYRGSMNIYWVPEVTNKAAKNPSKKYQLTELLKIHEKNRYQK